MDSQELSKAKSFEYDGFKLEKSFKYPQAIINYKRALKIYDELKNQEGIVFCLSSLGACYYYLEKAKGAIGQFNRLLGIKKKNKDTKNIEDIHYMMGTAYLYKLDNYKMSIRCYKKAVKLSQRKKDYSNLSYWYYAIGMAGFVKEKYSQSLIYFKKSLQIRKAHNDNYDIGSNYSYIAMTYIRLEKIKMALVYSLKHLHHIKETGYDRENGYIHIVIALALIFLEGKRNKHGKLIEDLTEISGFPPDENRYFKYAINKAEHNNYFDTLQPALYEYGRYLFLTGKQSEGLKLFSKYKKYALKLNLHNENLKAFCDANRISYSEL